MSDITIGPIQTYVGDSISSPSSANQNATQQSLSVNLTDSNLWLVDTSKLTGQTSNSQAQFTLLNLQTKYQTTVPFDNVNFTASTIVPTGLMSSESSYLQSNLPQGNGLILAAVTGGTQFSSTGISLSSSGVGRSETGSAVGAVSGGLAGAAGGSDFSSGGGSPGSTTGGDKVSPQVVPSPQSTVNPQSTPDPQPTINPQPTVNPQSPAPVPFEYSPNLGLLLILVIFSYRLVLKQARFE
jgi:hypothetical protein